MDTSFALREFIDLYTDFELGVFMRRISVLFTIVVALLWYLSIFYIAAPHDVHNQLFGGFGLTHEQHQILGVVLFMISLIVITAWAVVSKDKSESESSPKVQSRAQESVQQAS